MRTNRPRPRALLCAALLTAVPALAGCGGGEQPAAANRVTVDNCGEQVPFPSPAQRLFVNQGNRVATVLALGAADQVAAVSSLGDDRAVLGAAYGTEVVDGLNLTTDGQPSLENVVAQRADVVVSWFSDGADVTPDRLAARSIAAYQSTEGCKRGSGDARGTVEPWAALNTDLRNLGRITGRDREAEAAVADIGARRDALAAAPAAPDRPTVFLFDRGTTDVYSSGAFGAPQAIIEAAGARNALGDLQESWTSVSWERIVAADPDFIAFVDYKRQSYQDKVDVLRTNPATRDLPAVVEGRFLNLPFAMWTSSPLNIDAAEHLRAGLESRGLLPRSGVEPRLTLPG
ncbi:ABC transporter (iron.B12.siderophore.hemin), periplasmic substrate-binding component [Actinokineospora spheciospongiae]|uniref:ABC transporter (Iron.B12.siderophore.hemin), periplasmic substrate-binding component n=1 Tax=Actinokineospora spheciospongiae TaxID=909613 RepID=W7IKN3_9PSEU|nr:ABC transporter substrate-binding protein [Actinokineospora spheciospongiae]EWC60908.1 ABC transporter (iron.B12.siderophore.hemin), periplasmic substrate-binding component [Actinokineospora spheciospongiae]